MRVDIIIENNAYQSYIFDYSISDYDKINAMLAARHNNRHVAWWHVLVDYMKSNKPSMVFKPTDVLTVNFENEIYEETLRAYLDALTKKIRYKSYSNIIPWLGMLQEYWLDTNWNKKKKQIETKKVKKATISFSGSGSIASGSTPKARINPFKVMPPPRATTGDDWRSVHIEDLSMSDNLDDLFESSSDEIRATEPVVPDPTPLPTANSIVTDYDSYRLLQQRMLQEWHRIATTRTWTSTGTTGTPDTL